MRKLHWLLWYREYYLYSHDYEAVMVAEGEHKERATKFYSSAIKDMFLQGEKKWALDIALACIHDFTDEEVEFVQKNKQIYDYHFRYGMYVRNQYVHPSKFHVYLSPDRISSMVYDFIIAIVCPGVNPFAKNTEGDKDGNTD